MRELCEVRIRTSISRGWMLSLIKLNRDPYFLMLRNRMYIMLGHNKKIQFWRSNHQFMLKGTLHLTEKWTRNSVRRTLFRQNLHQWNLQNYLESAINKLSNGQYNFIRLNHSDYFDDQLKGGCSQNWHAPEYWIKSVNGARMIGLQWPGFLLKSTGIRRNLVVQ